MKILANSSLKVWACLLILTCLSACQSTPQGEQGLTERERQQEQFLEDMRKLQPSLTRLVAIEEELYMLIQRLEVLSQMPAQTQNTATVPSAPRATTVQTPVVSAPVTPLPVAQPAVSSMPEQPASTASSDGAENFALQITSITEPHRLPIIWQQMQRKYPQLLAGMEPNFQKVKVRDEDYYRLKVGGFATTAQAATKCDELKAAGLTCLVVNYTASNFAQLAAQ